MYQLQTIISRLPEVARGGNCYHKKIFVRSQNLIKYLSSQHFLSVVKSGISYAHKGHHYTEGILEQ